MWGATHGAFGLEGVSCGIIYAGGAVCIGDLVAYACCQVAGRGGWEITMITEDGVIGTVVNDPELYNGSRFEVMEVMVDDPKLYNERHFRVKMLDGGGPISAMSAPGVPQLGEYPEVPPRAVAIRAYPSSDEYFMVRVLYGWCRGDLQGITEPGSADLVARWVQRAVWFGVGVAGGLLLSSLLWG